jgi:hypothetical protein
MTTALSPEVTAILVTDDLSTIRKSLSYLRAQSGAERMEIVVAATRPDEVEPTAPELQGFASVRVIPIEDLSSPSLARAKGVQAATAPIVLFAETHSYPRPGYVEALVRAHRSGPWAAVGPSIANANPDTSLSWANLLLDYGRWVASDERGVIDDVPGHNGAYKREALLEFGDDLAQQLRADSIMHANLRARGYELYLEPEARVDHLNVSLMSSSVAERFHSSRHFAGLRARGWPVLRRLLYIGGTPLIPVVRLKRIAGFVRRSPEAPPLLRLLPALAFVLTLSAVGELAGYVFGPGHAGFPYEIEVYRSRFVRAADREQDADETTWPT